MKNFRKTLAIIMAVLAVGCLTAAMVLLIRPVGDYIQASESADGSAAEGLLSAGSLPGSAESSSPEPGETPSGGSMEPGGTPSDDTALPGGSSADDSAPPPAEPVSNPYADSFLANEDMAAWLQIPDTRIDYPVMWTPRDEEYYLLRGFDGKRNDDGCLILDTDSCPDPLTTNLIIHGHNMKSGAMFGTLMKYKDAAYYQEHKAITLYTKEKQRNYEVIAVFRSQVYRKSEQVFKFYKFFQADTPEEFDDFYRNIKALSLYDTGVTAEFGDHFLTLSTCSYHVEQGRFVVVAKETESGDEYLPIQNEGG